MRPQAKHLLLVFAIILTISTLVSGSFTFAYWNEVSLQDAIRQDLVRVEIRGIAEDGRFLQPMLEISLSKQSIWPLTVIIPRGLRLTTTSEESEVIVLQTEEVVLIALGRKTTLFANTLSYQKGFPNSSSIYQINATETNSDAVRADEFRSLLDHIIARQFQDELASQLAVWMTFHEVELEEIEEKLGQDFSYYVEDIKDLIELASPIPSQLPPPFELLFSLALTSVSFTLSLLSFSGLLFILHNKPHPSPFGLIKQLELEEWTQLKPGGMAEIWTAYDKRSGKKVIVKFPRTDLPPNGINTHTIMERFQYERIYHEMMAHENVVKLLESGSCYHPKKQDDVTEYLMLEFIEGKTIYQLISSGQYHEVRVEAIIEIVRQIIDALTHIHKKKVVHRDITSKNIMVDESGRVYLIDFGNAADFDSEHTGRKRLQSVGTPPFYPPDGQVGSFPAYDYYSLSVLIYAIYTGRHVMGRSQKQVKQDISRWYHEHSSEAPMVVRKALAWYLHETYCDNEDDSEQIRQEFFPSGRPILAKLVQQEDEPNEPNEPDDLNDSDEPTQPS